MTDEQLEAIRERNDRRKQIKGAATGSSGGSIQIKPDDRSPNNCQVVYTQRVPKEKAKYFEELYSSHLDQDLEAEADIDILLGEVRRLRGLLIEHTNT